MSRAAWLVVTACAVICGAIALSPGPVANAEGDEEWFAPATTTSSTTSTSTTASTVTTTTASTTASPPSTTSTTAVTTTTADEWLAPATTSTATTQATTTTGSTTSSSSPVGGPNDPGNGTSSTTSSSAPTTSTTAACTFKNPTTGVLEPGLPEDCLPAANPPGSTTPTVTSPSTVPTTTVPPPSSTPSLVDPSTTVPAEPASTGTPAPASELLANEHAAGGATTTTGTTIAVPPGDIDLDAVSSRSARVSGIGYDIPPVAPGEKSEQPARHAALESWASAVEAPSLVISFPWDRDNAIGVELGPGRVLGAWVIWMTITLLVMAFWVPSPTRRTSRVTVRRAQRGARRT